MSKQRRLTQSEIDELVRWREEHRWTAKRIADRLGISHSAVNYQLLKNGVDPWDAEAHPARQKQKGAFSPEEDARMLALGSEGVPLHRIAQIVGRPYTSTRIRILTLEVRAEKALERAA